MQRWHKHILFWAGVYFIWMYMKNFHIPVDFQGWLINLVQVGSYIALYYVVREVLIPRFFDQRRWWLFGLGLLGWTAMVIVIWTIIMRWIAISYTLPKLTLPSSYGAYVLEAVQMYVPGMILLAWESYEDADREEKRLHLLEKEKISTELNYLKAKVNPQFIFNTLKNLKTFVDEKSSKAPDMILRLSEVLDYVLYRSQKASVLLEEEIGVINGFIALEKLRLGNKININIKYDGDLTTSIAPLTLLSVVEHALKESVLGLSDNLDVQIDILSKDGQVDCAIDVNNVMPYGNTDGLTEIRRQLALTYPGRHDLRQKENNNATNTSLTLITAT